MNQLVRKKYPCLIYRSDVFTDIIYIYVIYMFHIYRCFHGY